MILFRIPIIVYIIILFLNMTAVFCIKKHVEDVNIELHKTYSEINKSQNSIQVLEAEWSYLTRPIRLEKLAHKYLKLKPILYNQINSNIIIKAQHNP